MNKLIYRNFQASAIAEFGPALIIIFLIMVFPLINFIGIMTGYATVEFMTNQVASSVAKSLNFSQNIDGSVTNTALNTLTSLTSTLNGSGFAKFAVAVPVGGYQKCGMDLYIKQINSTSGATTYSQADQPWTNGIIDPGNNLYQYQVRSYYNVGPLISMSGFPILNKIPGIGMPIVFNCVANVTAEHPEGLDNGSNYNSNNGMVNGMQSQSSGPGAGPGPGAGSGGSPASSGT